MGNRSTRARVGLIGLFALILMTVGLGSASALQIGYWNPSIWAESNGCETVTIHYEVDWNLYIPDLESLVELPAFNAQGTVNGVVKNGNGTWSTQIEFTGVAGGLADWSGSMWWDYGLVTLEAQPETQYFNQGTVQVEPCPTTTTTTITTTTQPESTTSSTIAQVETDLPESGGSGFGLSLAVVGFVAALLGGVAIRAARINN